MQDARMIARDCASRQQSAAAAQRRIRYVRRIESAPDAELRWPLLLMRLDRKLDIGIEIDAALDAIADLGAEPPVPPKPSARRR